MQDTVWDRRDGRPCGDRGALLQDPVDRLLVDEQVRVEFDQEFAAFRLIGQRAGDIEQGENVRSRNGYRSNRDRTTGFRSSAAPGGDRELLEGVGRGEIVEKGIDLLANVGDGEKLRKNRRDRGFIAFDDQGVDADGRFSRTCLVTASERSLSTS